ncbi:MAG: membrane protein insertase YidC [Proteiniphilum sp.]|jgi:YidC/Oxa1 family membrane protein insertase|nr:membrane protein insertase YidC [Proteiniphilum sp.]NCD14768.1 membrane protein insertase YidC [Bacteroidia bacterium]HHT33982.1 membrane protein insertase YidC [Bacteroidales bacterium]MDD2726036.1 membrane protein insertase YidC [Proteiniphilum sp.]MDD3331542.1 membrane protein insertase YidC [Proteiniphilum sp.]
MDKNTIIGLLLITAIIIGFSIFNRPSQEQIAAQQRMRDSLESVEKQPAVTDLPTDTSEKEVSDSMQGSSVADFFGAAAISTSSAADSSLVAVATSTDTLLAASPSQASEQTVVLENEKVRILLSTLGGSIRSVQLKEHLRHTGDSLYLFEDEEARFNMVLFNRNSVRLSTELEVFTPIRSADGNSVTMRLQTTPEQYIDFIYTLPEDEYMMDFDVQVAGMRTALHPESLTNFRMYWEQDLRQQEKGRMFENRYARIHYKYDRQDVQKLSESKDDRKELSEPLKWFAFKDQYFSAIVIGKKPFSNTILTSKVLDDPDHIKSYAAEVWVPVEISADSDLITAGFNYYFGPVHFNTLKAYDKGVNDSSQKLELEEIVYLGYKWLSWVNKWFVIPVFNFFLTLNWGMGLIILILTLMVKVVISPLTYKSYISSAKMRVLRPQIQELEKKYPGKEQDMMMKRQQATMELYNKVGVSPMSGCLPMLIQMPVLLAFFFFFPSAIELRQQGFLWADDLSTYDSLISWSGNIPFVTKYLGNHISIFCLLMTVVNVFYTKYNMSMTDTGSQAMPGMKYMPIFMSVFMFFFLNSYPAGLNYYYFLSTLYTIVITLIMKQTINEDKILAQLEANKKKPKKKSGFMARLAEAQKLQEKQAREKAKENAKRNYR